MQRASVEALFADYLHIINRTITQNRDRVPYKQIVLAGETLLRGRTIRAVVSGDSAEDEVCFTLALDDQGHLAIVDRDRGGAQPLPEPSIDWKVSRTHLEHVVSDPEPYIQSPLKLDFDWLKTRLGASGS